MRIGDVSRLVMVDAPAFTASFDGALPGADQLYWRGIVFTRFDGRSWYPERRTAARQTRVRGTGLSSYAVILEPHGQRHLFALDLPSTVNPVATIQADHTVVARRAVRQRFHYGASSILRYRQEKSEPPGPVTLQLPLIRNPRAIALGRQWAQEIEASDERVERALDLFRRNGFTYTLQPDRLGPDAVDDFLFSTRNGFCEHFATAFGVLMRAAGVPTRLVGGYQGGRWNTVGEFLTVRHSDAHVWCEVWLGDQGWVRIDPTVEVAPERIDAGIENAIRGKGLPGFLQRSRRGLVRWRDTLSQTWEAINIRWDLWFMGFSAEDQLAILGRLGMSLGRRGGWLLLMVVPPAFIAVTLLVRRMVVSRRRHPPADAALNDYRRFLAKMDRIGLPKAPHQGALDYARRVGRRRPRLKPEVDAITRRYIGLRYGHDGGREALKALRSAVRRFRPRAAEPGAVRRTDAGK
jgi:transglutaminase-like putative cysteine protease